MYLVKLAYDGYNQQFRLVDQKLSHMFEDGETYLCVVDFFPQQQTELDCDYVDLRHADIGHA